MIDRHGADRIVDAELAGEGRFGHRRHADHRAAVAREAPDLGCRFEPRALGDAVRPAPNRETALRGRGGDPASEQRRERLAEVDVPHRRAGSAERRRPPVRVIDELVRHGELAGQERRVDRADGVDTDAHAHAALLERPEIGAIVDLVRREPVILPVPRDARHARVADREREDGAARLAVRRLRRTPRQHLKTELLEAAADDQREARHLRSAAAA